MKTISRWLFLMPTWNSSDTLHHDKAGWSADKVILIQTLVTRVGKNINISRVKKFLSKCVSCAYMCRFLKTFKKKTTHFTQNNSWSKIIFKLERARKMIPRYISVYLCFVTLKKVVHSQMNNDTMIILMFSHFT